MIDALAEQPFVRSALLKLIAKYRSTPKARPTASYAGTATRTDALFQSGEPLSVAIAEGYKASNPEFDSKSSTAVLRLMFATATVGMLDVLTREEKNVNSLPRSIVQGLEKGIALLSSGWEAPSSPTPSDDDETDDNSNPPSTRKDVPTTDVDKLNRQQAIKNRDKIYPDDKKDAGKRGRGGNPPDSNKPPLSDDYSKN